MQELIAHFSRAWGVDRLVDIIPGLSRLWGVIVLPKITGDDPRVRVQLLDEEIEFLAQASRREDHVALMVGMCCMFGEETAYGMVYRSQMESNPNEERMIDAYGVRAYVSSLRAWFVDGAKHSRSLSNMTYPSGLEAMVLRREFERAAMVAWFATRAWVPGPNIEWPVVESTLYLMLPALVVGETGPDPFWVNVPVSFGGAMTRPEEFFPRADWLVSLQQAEIVRDYLLWAAPFMGVIVGRDALDGLIGRLDYLSGQGVGPDGLMRSPAGIVYAGFTSALTFLSFYSDVDAWPESPEHNWWAEWEPMSMRIDARLDGAPEVTFSPPFGVTNVVWAVSFVDSGDRVTSELMDLETNAPTGIIGRPMGVTVVLSDSIGLMDGSSMYTNMGSIMGFQNQTEPGGPGDLASISFGLTAGRQVPHVCGVPRFVR